MPPRQRRRTDIPYLQYLAYKADKTFSKKFETIWRKRTANSVYCDIAEEMLSYRSKSNRQSGQAVLPIDPDECELKDFLKMRFVVGHEWVDGEFKTENEAAMACHTKGYKRLCSPHELEHMPQCTGGWAAGFTGLYLSEADPSCGEKGLNEMHFTELRGAYCCEHDS